MKFNHIDTQNTRKSVYINAPQFQSAFQQKNHHILSLKNRFAGITKTKHNVLLMPEIILTLNKKDNQLSPNKKKKINYSSSFDRFLLSISKEQTLNDLLANKTKQINKAKFNKINNKNEVDPNRIKKDNREPPTNDSYKKTYKNRYLYLNYTIIEDNLSKNASKKKITANNNPPVINPGNTKILDKERIKQITRNKRELSFPNILNSYVQMAKMNPLLLNLPQKYKKDTIMKNKNNYQNRYNCLYSLKNSNYNCKTGQISESHKKATFKDFNTKEVIVEDIKKKYQTIPVENEASALNSNNTERTIEILKEDCYPIDSNEGYNFNWNNKRSLENNIELQKEGADCYANDIIEEEIILSLDQKKDDHNISSLKSSIDNNETAVNQANKTLIDLFQDTFIYNKDYFQITKHFNKNVNGSSFSNEAVNPEDIEEDIIENNNSVYNEDELEENDSKKTLIFKSLRCYYIKVPNLLPQLLSKLNYIVGYLDIRSISALIQVNSEVSALTTPILYDNLINIILNGTNDAILSLIKPSIFNYSSVPELDSLTDLYLNYLNMKSNYSIAIGKDLKRTILDDVSFAEGSTNNKKLKNILTAYANYNNSIGYAQGMNFLVANSIYLFNKEEEVFLFIDGLINKFQLEDLYGVTNTLNNKIEEVGQLIDKHAPNVVKHLSDNGLNHQFFTSNWVLTLFSNTMKTKYLFMFWDFMIIFGWRFFYCFCVEIIKWNEKEIISSEVKRLSATMKGLMKKESFENNFHSIIKETFCLMNEHLNL